MQCKFCFSEVDKSLDKCPVCGTFLHATKHDMQKINSQQDMGFVKVSSSIKNAEAKVQDINMQPQHIDKKAFIILLKDSLAIDEIELDKQEIFLGRDDPDTGIKNDIDVSCIDSEKISSRRHAKIHYDGNNYHLIDISSSNGTFIRSKKLQPNVPELLRDGDLIILGEGSSVLLKFKGG